MIKSDDISAMEIAIQRLDDAGPFADPHEYQEIIEMLPEGHPDRLMLAGYIAGMTGQPPAGCSLTFSIGHDLGREVFQERGKLRVH